MKITKLLTSLTLVAAVISASSCGKLEDRINALEQRISELEDTTIPSIDEQVAAIKKTIGDMEKTDEGLREYVSLLEDRQTSLATELGKTNKALTEAQEALRNEMTEDKSEVSGEIDAAKSEVIAQLEAYKTFVSGELQTIQATIESLKAKDENLQQKVEELRAYVDSENGKIRDWADATFATIEQNNNLAEIVAGIKTQFETLNNYTMNMDVRLTNKAEELSKSLSSLDESTKQQIESLTEQLSNDISTLRTELTDAYTKLVATEVTKLETSMKSWVNEQLDGYYTIEQTDAKLEAMKSELEGRMDSDKTYLVTLIANLEMATNKKISANTTLITGLRSDLVSLSQTVAENAGKIADESILISQNAADISKNSTVIAENTKDLAAVKKLSEENQKLIAANTESLAEMQRLYNTLKDSGIEDYVETILQNTKDIASNVSLIAKNAESIKSNAAAIAQNASDIQALQSKLDDTKTELVESYTAAIAKAISDYDGTITSKLASEIAKIEDKITAINSEIESIKTRIVSLEDKVSKLEEIVSQINDISYIPRYADGAERVVYTRDALDIIPGDVTLRFDVHPASAASEIAANWEDLLSARAVYTLIKSSDVDFIDLKVKGATAENGVLYVTVSSDELNKDFILGDISASMNIKITSSSKNAVSDYVRLNPSFPEEPEFICYLLNKFDIDGDGILELNAVESATEIDVAGMKISNINNVISSMPRLEKLDCSNTSIDALDVSNNSMLRILNCANNKLSELDITKNENIIEIDFGGNNLSEVEQTGLLIGKLRWSIFNYGATSTSSTGTFTSIYSSGSRWLNLCPDGWRIPSKSEFTALEAYIYLGTDVGLDDWFYFKETTTKALYFPTGDGYWNKFYWTSTQYDSSNNYVIKMSTFYTCQYSFVSKDPMVRCVKDE